MRRPWWIVAPLAWAGVVALVALTAWWVIESAGDEVLADRSRDVAPSATAPERTTTRAPGPPVEPSRSTDAPTDPTTVPSPPQTEPTAEQTAGQTSEPAAPETSAPAPVTRTQTWQGEAGVVRVSCTGPQLRLEGASPADGYEIDTSTHHSGAELEVRFRSADGDREVEVEAECVGGTPSFRVEYE